MRRTHHRTAAWSAALLPLLLVGVGLRLAPADPAAVIVQLRGSVEVERAGQPATPATVGMRLMAGDRVAVGADARATLLYRTGRMETATASATITEPGGGEAAGLFERTVQTLANVAATDARTQPNRQGMIRPIAGAAVPIAPRNGITVLETRPTFVWFRIPEATGYTLQIRRQDGTPVRYETGPDTAWTLPASEPPLVPGATYEWTVAASDGGRVAPPQSFRVIGAEGYTLLAERLGEVLAMGADPAGDGLFLAALVYRDAGLFYEARAALNRLERAGITSGRPLHLLRGEVYDALGELEAAAREFERADAEPVVSETP